MIGQRIGSYRIMRQLGEGGMGLVFAAVHEQLGRQAAIKVLHPELSTKPEFASRFFNEARAVNIVQHPGLVNIYEIGRLPDGATYIVMEYLEGESLACRMRRPAGLPLPDLLCLSRQIASALAAAHRKGIVHRDLKPENVMVVPDPEAPLGERAKVLDFGIAKFAASGVGAGTLGRTKTGVLMGTPRYMAPEQCHGASQVDDRADVYSLGVMLYEAVCGHPPFVSEGLGELLLMHICEPPRPLSEQNPAAPPELAALVHAMLAKAPAERPSMAQVVSLLEQLGAPAAGGAQSSQPGARTPISITVPPFFPSTLGQAAGQTGSTARRSFLQTAALAVIVALVTLLGVEAVSRHHDSQPPHAASAPPRQEGTPPPPPARPPGPEVPDGGAPDARPPGDLEQSQADFRSSRSKTNRTHSHTKEKHNDTFTFNPEDPPMAR